jgi:hypothetical protein
MISKREILLLLVGTIMVTSNAYNVGMSRAQTSSRVQSLKKNNLAQTKAQSIVSPLYSANHSILGH